MTWDALAALALVALAAGLLLRRLWSPAPKCGNCQLASSSKKSSQRRVLSALGLSRQRPLGRL